MIRSILMAIVCVGTLSATSPVMMATDLHLSDTQIKQLQRIDATVANVNRYAELKRLSLLTQAQKKIYCSQKKCACNGIQGN